MALARTKWSLKRPTTTRRWPRFRQKESRTFCGRSGTAFSISKKTGASNTSCSLRTMEKRPAPRWSILRSNLTFCAFCDAIRQEIESGTRVVAENEDFLTLAPYAPRFPFETWILPKRHESAFENSSSQMFENLAHALKLLLMKADRVLDNPPYNLVVHTSPEIGRAHV